MTSYALRRVRLHGELLPLLVVWLSWLVLMASANLATPLYHVYATRFGFSSLVLTAVFATYAFVLVPTLVLFGRLSDRVGRRPVLLAGLLTGCAGLALFAAASGTAWLFGARALQGLAVGMISGAATAALVELDPRRDEQRPALLAGLAQTAGSGVGPLLAGLLAQWAPKPLRLPYLAVLGALLVAAAGTLLLSGEERRADEPWRIQRPRVPDSIRAAFARVSITAAVLWATAALFLSIVPSYTSRLLHTSNLALLGALAALVLAASSVAQVVGQRRGWELRRAQAGGLVVLALALVALIVAAPLASLPLLVASAVGAGLGHGAGILAAQDELNGMAPSERRGEVTAAYIASIYAGVAVAVIGSGLLADVFTLPLAVGAIAGALALVAVCAAVWHLRTTGA